MKILVLGGKAFVGRAFVEVAIEHGHKLTLFNRGRRNPELFPDVESIQGDRGVDVSGLLGRKWDAVLDTSGYFPRVVGMSVEALKDSADAYMFVSSISAYKDFSVPNQNEESALATCEGPISEEITAETYGPLKVHCEQTAQKAFGDRAVIVRPGLIVGPYDLSDRFTYWPVRMDQGGDVLVPDLKDQPVQIIDVRDLARWCVELLEQGVTGVFNATGPQIPYTLGEVLLACAKGTDSNLIWVSREFLNKHEVQPWSDLPMLLDMDGSANGMSQIDVSKAAAAGLTIRPLAETIRDTREWAQTRPVDHTWRAGLTPMRESELLNAWDAEKIP